MLYEWQYRLGGDSHVRLTIAVVVNIENRSNLGALPAKPSKGCKAKLSSQSRKLSREHTVRLPRIQEAIQPQPNWLTQHDSAALDHLKVLLTSERSRSNSAFTIILLGCPTLTQANTLQSYTCKYLQIHD